MGEGNRKAGEVLTAADPVEIISNSGGSDWTNALRSIDADEATAWVGTPRDGVSWLVLACDAPVLSEVEVVLAADSCTNVTFLGSADAEVWYDLRKALEDGPVILNHVWLIFPQSGADPLPVVKEIYLRRRE